MPAAWLGRTFRRFMRFHMFWTLTHGVPGQEQPGTSPAILFWFYSILWAQNTAKTGPLPLLLKPGKVQAPGYDKPCAKCRLVPDLQCAVGIPYNGDWIHSIRTPCRHFFRTQRKYKRKVPETYRRQVFSLRKVHKGKAHWVLSFPTYTRLRKLE